MLKGDPPKPPKRKSVQSWMKEQESLGRLPFQDVNSPEFKEMIKLGKYPSYYDPKITRKDETGGLINNDGSKATLYEHATGLPSVEVTTKKAVQVDPNRKSKVFGEQVFDPNTGKYYDYSGNEVKPIIEGGMKKGGLVKKYVTGGTIDPLMGAQTQGVVSGLAGPLSALGTTAATAIQAGNMPNEQGEINENKAALAGGLKWASTAAPIAANPALLAATGGLSALAIPLAGGIGAIVGARKAGQQNDESVKQFKEQKDAEQQSADQLRAEDALRKRDLGYSKGGKIVGKGTATSDGITAKVREGSFIVPAKNAPVAEEIREKVLRKAPSKKAALKQVDGVEVKLSNGEHMFTPEEVNELASNGIDVNTLAPEAKNKLTEYLKCGGKVRRYWDGGEVDGDERGVSKKIVKPEIYYEPVDEHMDEFFGSPEIIPFKDKTDSLNYIAGYNKGLESSELNDEQLLKYTKKQVPFYHSGLIGGAVAKSASDKQQQAKDADYNKNNKPQLTNEEVINLARPVLRADVDVAGADEELSKRKSVYDSLNKYDKERVDKMVQYLSQNMAKGGRVAPIRGYAKGGTVEGKEDIGKFISEQKDRISERDAALKKMEAEYKADQQKAEGQRKFRKDVWDGIMAQMEENKEAKRELEEAETEFNALKESYDTMTSQQESAMSKSTTAAERAGVRSLSRPSQQSLMKDQQKIIALMEKTKQKANSAKQRLDKASNVGNYLPESAKVKSGKSMDYGVGGTKETEVAQRENYVTTDGKNRPTTKPIDATQTASTKRVAPKRTSATTSKLDTAAINDEFMRNANASLDSDYENTLAETNTLDASLPKQTESSLAAKTTDVPSPDPTTAPPQTGGPSWGGIAQQALGYAIPAIQAGIGASALSKFGKRPVDKLDPEYLASIKAAKDRASIAEQEALYGFSPEEKSLIANENQGLLNQAKYAAQNLSGGSGVGGYNMISKAISDNYSRGLMAKVQDRALRLQKQGIAADRAAYADQLVAGKTDMNRRLFNDTMTAWQQNQQAAGNLTSQGLTNLMSQNRYNQFLQNRDAYQ